jgi:hypothetical protein
MQGTAVERQCKYRGGFYTQEYITSSASYILIRSCIEDGGAQYFAALRFGGADIG